MTEAGIVYGILTAVIKVSIFILFTAIAYDFYKYSGKSDVVKEKKSLVETGSMTAFFLVYYVVLVNKILVIDVDAQLKLLCAVVGTAMVFTGAVLNVLGRITLSGNWANHIKIYDNHTLVRTGLYRYVRHPLYSTIIFMLIGGSLASQNALSLLLVIIIFIPFMVYRARQEEMLLQMIFIDYKSYKLHTGMLFPKLIRKGGTHDTH